MSSIEFDPNRAKEFQGKLDSTMQEVLGELKKMETKVTKCREWWKGGSEEGFIKSFSNTRKMIDRRLTDCAREYKRLVDEIKKVKEQEERELKAEMSKIQ